MFEGEREKEREEVRKGEKERVEYLATPSSHTHLSI